jgi:short-subunit dehydrogenase
MSIAIYLEVQQHPETRNLIMMISSKLALITGASSGIGAAAAKAIAKEGARVVLLARGEKALAQVAAEITSTGGTAWKYRVDLTDPIAIATVGDQISHQLGIPDILINSAGVGKWRFTDETSPAEAVECMTVPYFAAFNIVHYFLPAMLRRRSGHIVNIGSVGSRFVWPGATAYLAARWALAGFSEALRADLVGCGIQVTLLEPGVVKSPYWEHNPGSRERVPKLAKLIPELSPEEVAQAIVRGVKRNKRTIVIPFMMRLFCGLHAVFPCLLQWLINKTGYRRRVDPSGAK